MTLVRERDGGWWSTTVDRLVERPGETDTDQFVLCVVESVAGLSGTDSGRLPPITETDGPDALDRLVDDIDADEQYLAVAFDYHDYLVTVRGDGHVSTRADD